MSRLDDREFALFVAQGRASIRVRVLEGGETARIDTPNAQVTITRPGLYRIDVTPDREHTHVVVREGEVEIQTASALQQVLPGQSADVDGPTPQYATVQNGIGIDGFDASENETTNYTTFESGKWYKVRLRVTDKQIQAWLDDERIVAVDTEGKRLSVRIEVDQNRPLGFATYQTTGAYRKIEVRELTKDELAAKE